MVQRKRVFSRKTEIFLEFLLFGVAIGIIEDLIAIKFATGDPITWGVIGIAIVVAIPFAFLGEVIIDRRNIIPVWNNNTHRRKRK